MANSNKKKNKNNDGGSKRSIKQVYVDNQGEEIADASEVDSKEAIENAEDTKNVSEDIQVEDVDKEEPEIEVIGKEKVRDDDDEFLEVHEENAKKKRGIRIAIVAAALVFSLLLSSLTGTFLALWDTNKTFADLSRAVFGSKVMAAEIDAKESEAQDEAYIEEDKVVEEDVQETTKEDEASSKEAAKNTDITSDEDKEARAEATDSAITEEISGVDSFVKAGTDDIITNIGETTQVIKYVDPNQYYPVPYTTVDESYFKDALFIGDSRMQGFGMWSGLPATYYTAVGFQVYKYDTTKVVQTEEGKVPIFDAMPYDAFSKVYIKVGLNELGLKESAFEEKYAEVIAKVREREPRAIIYIHGLLPVTADKSATDGTHNNAMIVERNEALKEFATGQKAYYLDAYTAFAGADGCLPAEMTGDGIHLKSQYMSIWKNFLMQNAVMLTY